jgi:hypothetical protein
MFQLALQARGDFEKIIRIGAFSSGILIVTAADKLGLPIADLILRAISDFGPLTYSFVAVFIPSFAGMAATWYCIRCLERKQNVAIRLAILFGVFSIFQFAELYVKAASAAGFALNKALVPNIMFTLSVSLYLILRYDPNGRQGSV